jgi:micrococcal nuclease
MNRLHRSIALPATMSFNFKVVRRGFAQAATYPPDVRFADSFLTADRGAWSAGVGLWAPSPEATPASTPVATLAPTRAPTSRNDGGHDGIGCE